MTEPNYVLRVDGMMCQKNCATTVCKAIKAVHSVTNAEVTFAAEEAKVWAPLNSIAAVISAVEDVGYDAVLKSKQSADKAPNDDVGYMDIDSIGGREERADTGHTEVGIDLDVDLDNEDSQPPDLVLQIGGLRDREACALKIVTALLTVDGVLSVNIDFDRKTASIWGFADYASITKSVEGAGYTVNDGHSDAAATNSSSKLHQNAKKSPHTTAGKEVIELLCESEDTKQIQAKLGVVNGVDKITFDANNGVVSIVIDSSLLSADHVADILRGHGISSAVKKVSTVEPDTAAADYSVELSITGMSCANCAAKIERSLGKLPGVSSATISSMTNRGLVVLSSHSSHATGTRDIVDAVQAMGYGCELLSNDAGKGHSLQDSAEIEMNEWWRLLMIAVVFGIPVLILHTIESMTMGSVTFLDNAAVCGDGITTGQLLMFLLNSPIMVIVGFRFYKAAFLGAMHGSYGMDLLVVTGTSVTFAYSCVQLLIACRSDMPASHVYFEAAGMLLMFVTVGKYVEAYAKGRTVASISSLLQLQPREANLVKSGVPDLDSIGPRRSEVVQKIAVDLVQKGDVVKVLPGDRIPTDGIIVSGRSHIDESMITGESIPLSKAVGDQVFGSTVCQNETIYIRVTAVGSESALAQIVRLVEAAQMNKAPVQAYADRIAGVFTPVILLIASLTFVSWLTLCITRIVPEDWYREEHDDPFLFAMMFAISVVVISCPCALGLATPTAILVGTSVGAANGILIKGGAAFETAQKISTVVLDKTGTLTKGKPQVTDLVLLEKLSTALKGTELLQPTFDNREVKGSKSEKVSEEDCLLWIAASVEQCSDHPLARALREAAVARNMTLIAFPTSSYHNHIGHGVRCESQHGRILVGSRGILESNGIPITSIIDSAMWDLEVQGKTAICVAFENIVVGVVAIADVAKPESLSTIAMLRSMKIDVWMLTGDSKTTAEALADELDIPKDRVMACCLPKDKIAKVIELQEKGECVAMVGDGINDSPALAQADVGIAIGTGTEVAIEAADMVLIRDNMHDLVVAIDLARLVFARIKQNLLWAVVYNFVAVPYAAGVWFPWTRTTLHPQYAGLAMALSSVSVVISSMALKLYKRPANLSNKENFVDSRSAGTMFTRIMRTFRSKLSSIFYRDSSGKNSKYLQLPSRDSDEGVEISIFGRGKKNFDHDDGII